MEGTCLAETGEKMKIQKRQFIGEHPIVKEIVIRVVNNNLKEINEQILKASKQ
ncbi:hypothetical protein [Flavobacterium columnare]|uniref:hypothetical protein n=1 Tax=Flavobacterium columnare TaxID=996 RepID=UPI00298A051E|nr:hypothetical protein [Flavobacterium columnare]